MFFDGRLPLYLRWAVALFVTHRGASVEASSHTLLAGVIQACLRALDVTTKLSQRVGRRFRNDLFDEASRGAKKESVIGGKIRGFSSRKRHRATPWTFLKSTKEIVSQKSERNSDRLFDPLL